MSQADYRLHLPRGAIVSGFGFWRDGRFLAAELKEKQEARQAHSDAPTPEPTLTLVTCYPFDAVWPGGALRYVVYSTGQTSGSTSNTTARQTRVRGRPTLM